MPQTRQITLERGNERITVPTLEWNEMMSFLATCGWEPFVPPSDSWTGELVVPAATAQNFAQAGEVVLEETLKDPLTAYSLIRFDMGTFASMVYFAQEGEFIIRNS